MDPTRTRHSLVMVMDPTRTRHSLVMDPTRTRHSLVMVMDPTRKRALRLQSDIHDPCHWCGSRRPHVALWRQVTLVNWVLVAGHQFVLQHTREVYQNQEVLTCVV